MATELAGTEVRQPIKRWQPTKGLHLFAPVIHLTAGKAVVGAAIYKSFKAVCMAYRQKNIAYTAILIPS